jgi:MoaA/NifB/PqqE/SkfB family radical SAM enzyme
MEEIHYLFGNRCNLNCKFCFWDKSAKDVPFEFKKNIVDQIADTGIKKVTMSGGEPLCGSNFLYIINYMHKKGLEIILHTNGLLIDRDLAYEISKYVSRVSLTMDGSNEKIAQDMRENSEIFPNTINLINLLHQLNVDTNIKTLVTNVNKDDILNIGNVVSNLPIKYWSLLEFCALGRGLVYKEKFSISEGVFEEICHQAKSSFPQLDIRIRKYSDNKQPYCFIASNGEVYSYQKNIGDVLVGNLSVDNLSQIIKKIERKN